ncbi:MAG TPA: hypothetical protein PKW67_01940 [Syntrophomonadaceae bacterium]|nr:hypothetical protein [Syntrophomonadaceae bacterium]
MEMDLLISLLRGESGQGMAEYVLILTLIAMIIMAALGPLGDAIALRYGEITAAI